MEGLAPRNHVRLIRRRRYHRCAGSRGSCLGGGCAGGCCNTVVLRQPEVAAVGTNCGIPGDEGIGADAVGCSDGIALLLC
jgi:hypothetical protein